MEEPQVDEMDAALTALLFALADAVLDQLDSEDTEEQSTGKAVIT